MLIRFSVKNWCSFKDTATLDMTAGYETQHLERQPHLKKFLDILSALKDGDSLLSLQAF